MQLRTHISCRNIVEFKRANQLQQTNRKHIKKMSFEFKINRFILILPFPMNINKALHV